MKKWIYSIIILIVGISGVAYLRTYNIYDNGEGLKVAITKFLDKSREKDIIEIRNSCNIDNKKYILFTINDNLANSILLEGVNKKYKIDSIEIFKSNIQFQIEKSKNKKYLIVYGINKDEIIDTMELNVNYTSYKMKVPKEKYFIMYKDISKELENESIKLDNIKFYSSNGIDITKQVYSKN